MWAQSYHVLILNFVKGETLEDKFKFGKSVSDKSRFTLWLFAIGAFPVWFFFYLKKMIYKIQKGQKSM